MSRALAFVIAGLALVDLTEAAAPESWQTLGGLRTASLLIALGLVISIWKRCNSGVHVDCWLCLLVAGAAAWRSAFREWNRTPTSAKHVTFSDPVSFVVNGSQDNNEAETLDTSDCEDCADDSTCEECEGCEDKSFSMEDFQPEVSFIDSVNDARRSESGTRPSRDDDISPSADIHASLVSTRIITTYKPDNVISLDSPSNARNSEDLSNFSFRHVLGSEARQSLRDFRHERPHNRLTIAEIQNYIRENAPTFEELVAEFSERADRLQQKILLMNAATEHVTVHSGRLYLEN